MCQNDSKSALKLKTLNIINVNAIITLQNIETKLHFHLNINNEHSFAHPEITE